jgi:hypothetical protein
MIRFLSILSIMMWAISFTFLTKFVVTMFATDSMLTVLYGLGGIFLSFGMFHFWAEFAQIVSNYTYRKMAL